MVKNKRYSSYGSESPQHGKHKSRVFLDEVLVIDVVVIIMLLSVWSWEQEQDPGPEPGRGDGRREQQG